MQVQMHIQMQLQMTALTGAESFAKPFETHNTYKVMKYMNIVRWRRDTQQCCFRSCGRPLAIEFIIENCI